QLQLNAFEPIIANALFRSFKHLTAACTTLADKCVRGITANAAYLRETLERSLALATALNPYIGYKNASLVASEAHSQNATIRDIVLRRGLMTEAQLDEALRPEALIAPRVHRNVISAVATDGAGAKPDTISH
ncbi:MAG TPA: aspartate ammonia-lyase, partial [Paraburkholderia sp.]